MVLLLGLILVGSAQALAMPIYSDGTTILDQGPQYTRWAYSDGTYLAVHTRWQECGRTEHTVAWIWADVMPLSVTLARGPCQLDNSRVVRQPENTSSVPEPASAVLLSFGFLAAGGMMRRYKRLSGVRK